MCEENFYTYMWLREDGTPYYVGKGKGNRAYRKAGHNVSMPKNLSRVTVQHWFSEEEAFTMEKWWIALFGRKDNNTGVLRNLTDGGENPPKMLGNTHAKGKKHSAEANARKSEAGKRRKQSEKTKEKLRKIRKAIGTPWLLGRKVSEETKTKISKSHIGLKHSEESKKKMSISAKKRRLYNELF